MNQINIELGLIDSMWDCSVHIGLNDMSLWMTSPSGLNNGWYHATIDLWGLITNERRMLAEGKYDSEPSKNRPNMVEVVKSVPVIYTGVIRALIKAYQLEPSK